MFDVLRCPDEDKVRLAAFLLKGNAYYWWKVARRGYADPSTITWEEFQRIFFDQFYPHSYRDEKKDEFSGLTQGSMSVLEYEQKFVELSRFAPELIPNETEKCRRFMKGLWLDIQSNVTATVFPTMRDLAQAADRVAQTFRDVASTGRRRRDTTNFGGSSQGPSKRGGSSSGSAGSGWSGGYSSSPGSGWSGPGSDWSPGTGKQSVGSSARGTSQRTGASSGCHRCGQVGHFRRDCPLQQSSDTGLRTGITCYNCGQAGHLRSGCPYLVAQ